MPAPKRITVVIADQHPVVRAGIKSALGPTFQVVASVDNGREAGRLVQKFKPAVVITDITMPLLNGLESARQIIAAFPRTHVILLTALKDPHHIEDAIRIGVKGYLLKSSSIENLPRAVRSVLAGHKAYSPEIERFVKAHKNLFDKSKAPASGLTPREIEVIQLIAEGKQTKQIAAELGAAQKTVEKHRQSLMNKLDLHDIASLTSFAIRTGISEGK